MGILKDAKTQETPGSATKRRSLQPDFSSLGPLKPGGTVGFLNFRDNQQEKRKNKKNKKTDDDMDSDDDDDDSILGKADDEEAKGDDRNLSPDDIRFGGELAEGVRKIKVSDKQATCFLSPRGYVLTGCQLKRQHSAASLSSDSKADSTSTPASGEAAQSSSNASAATPGASAAATEADSSKQAMGALNGASAGSPLKKQRASVSGADENAIRKRIGSSLSKNISEALESSSTGDTTGFGTISSAFGDTLKPQEPAQPAQPAQSAQPAPQPAPPQPNDEEEL